MTLSDSGWHAGRCGARLVARANRPRPRGIQGDEVRVSSKKRDDLQGVIAILKKAVLDVAFQFVNYR